VSSWFVGGKTDLVSSHQPGPVICFPRYEVIYVSRHSKVGGWCFAGSQKLIRLKWGCMQTHITTTY